MSDEVERSWLKENAPSGWIDDLRKENARLRAALRYVLAHPMTWERGRVREALGENDDC